VAAAASVTSTSTNRDNPEGKEESEASPDPGGQQAGQSIVFKADGMTQDQLRAVVAAIASAPGEQPPEEKRTRAIVERLVVFILFGAFFGLMPVWANGIKIAMASDREPVLSGALGSGELFIVSAVMAAAAVGELFVASMPKSAKIWQVIGGWSCVACCVGNVILYVVVNSGTSPVKIVDFSIWFFVGALLSSALCVGLAAGR
jgi:hypothetical protein